MKVPVQSPPVFRSEATPRKAVGILPSGNNTQCCGSNCQTTYCLIGLSSKGCSNGQPYVNCIAG